MAEARPDAPSRRAPRPRLSPRRRTALEAAIFLVTVFFLGWGADALSRMGAEALLARNIQNATGVAEQPVVRVHGFAFVPQVVRGAYDRVDVTILGITSGPLRIERVDAQLSDVRVPFHDVLVQNIRRVGIGHSVEEVTLRYEDLNAYFEATGRPLALRRVDDGELELSGPVDVLGQSVAVRAEVELTVRDDTLRLDPQRIDTGPTRLSPASRLLLAQRLRLSVPLGTLPFGQTLTEVTPTADDIRVQAGGRAIVVQP